MRETAQSCPVSCHTHADQVSPCSVGAEPTGVERKSGSVAQDPIVMEWGVKTAEMWAGG